jgi:hypothetical protein
MQTSPPFFRRLAVYARALAPHAGSLLDSIARAASAMADAASGSQRRPPEDDL